MRTIDPPGTLASAAARTFDSAVPVRSVSSERCEPHGCDALGAATAAVAGAASELPDAAEAMPKLPAPTPIAIAATATSLLSPFMCVPFSGCQPRFGDAGKRRLISR